METFNRIVELLDEKERANETIKLMLQAGSVTRTDSGNRFFNSRLQDEHRAIVELHQYPQHWVEGVKTVLALRKKNIKGRVPEL